MHRPISRRSFLAAGAGLGAAAITPVGARSTRSFLSRHDLPIGLQLYTVADAARADLAGTFARISAIGYRAVELAGFHGHRPTELRAAADRAGLRLTSIHLGAASRNGDPGLGGAPEQLAAALKVLGVRRAILPVFLTPDRVGPQAPGESYIDFLRRAADAMAADDWHQNADFLNRAGAALKAHGIALGYHNHNPELRPLPGGRTGLDILLEQTDPALVSFEMDAGWVAAAGVNPLSLLARHPTRFAAMHVKDIRASTVTNYTFYQDPCPVGQGVMPWPRLLADAYRAGIRDFFVEQEPPFANDRFDAIAESYAYLARMPA